MVPTWEISVLFWQGLLSFFELADHDFTAFRAGFPSDWHRP